MAVAVLYLLAGNVLLLTPLLRRATNLKPEEFFLEYDSAYTLFPGNAHVKGLKIRFQDGNIQFRVTLDEAAVQIALFDLILQKFHATSVRGTGVSWRMLHKVKQVEGAQKRVAAFPVIEGFEGPPVQVPPPPGPASSGDGLWSVRLDNVDVGVREVWMLEYHYVGAGRAQGAFELRPMKSVWVDHATLALKEGTLTTGPAAISKNFTLQAEVTIAPVDIPSSPGLKILRPLTASVQLAALIDGLGAVELYQPGLEASGTGTLTADLRVTEGRFSAGTVLETHLDDVKLRSEGAGFNGTMNASFKLAPDAKGAQVPVGHGAMAGSVLVPISKESLVPFVVSGLGADLSLETSDLVEGLGLSWLHAKLAEARVTDARGITAAAAQKAPVIAPAVLGNGPLVALGTAEVTKSKSLIRLKHAKLGDAELEGAAVKTGQAWNGAASGRVAVVPIGLRLKDGALEVVPFIKEGWLSSELAKLGIKPDLPVR